MEMVREKKAEQIIGRMKKGMGFSNKQIIAWLSYRDRSEESIIAYMHTYPSLERGGVSIFPNKTCDQKLRFRNSRTKSQLLGAQPQPQPGLERMRSYFCNGGEAIPTV